MSKDMERAAFLVRDVGFLGLLTMTAACGVVVGLAGLGANMIAERFRAGLVDV